MHISKVKPPETLQCVNATIYIGVVDDDPIQHFLFKKCLANIMLNNLSVSASFFNSPIEFFEFAYQNPSRFQLLFLDINMPEMDGFQLLQKVEPLLKESRVYFISSSVDSEDLTKAMSFSCVRGYINKPIDQNKLRSILSTDFRFTNREDQSSDVDKHLNL